MSINVDTGRLEAALKIAETNGPLKSQDELWNKIKNLYNSTDRIPRYKGRPKEAITKGIVYRYVTRKLQLPVKTEKKKAGRPKAESPRHRRSIPTETIGKVLDYLQDEAVSEQWNESNADGWDALNSCRVSIGLKPVKPTNHPEKEYFNE